MAKLQRLKHFAHAGQPFRRYGGNIIARDGGPTSKEKSRIGCKRTILPPGPTFPIF
jgi:hypothetical protein